MDVVSKRITTSESFIRTLYRRLEVNTSEVQENRRRNSLLLPYAEWWQWEIGILKHVKYPGSVVTARD